MSFSDTIRVEPQTVGIQEAIRLTGATRSWLYKHGRRRGVIMLKAEKRTLVDVASLRSVITALPRV